MCVCICLLRLSLSRVLIANFACNFVMIAVVYAPGQKVVVTMDHTAKDGTPKIMEKCSLPLTGHNVVDRIITDMGVFDCDKAGGSGLTLIEIAPGITLEDVIAATDCSFKVADPLPLMDNVVE